MAAEKSGLKRPQKPPVDLFTLQPEPELLDEVNVVEVSEVVVEAPKPKAKPRRRRPRVKKEKGEEEKPEEPEKNVHVSLYVQPDVVRRLDALKHKERLRLKSEEKRVARSTLINEAIEKYLIEMET